MFDPGSIIAFTLLAILVFLAVIMIIQERSDTVKDLEREYNEILREQDGVRKSLIDHKKSKRTGESVNNE